MTSRTICSTKKLNVDSVLHTSDGRTLAASVDIGIGVPGGGGCALRFSQCVEKECNVLGLSGNCAKARHAFLPLKAYVCFVLVVEPAKQ